MAERRLRGVGCFVWYGTKQLTSDDQQYVGSIQVMRRAVGGERMAFYRERKAIGSYD